MERSGTNLNALLGAIGGDVDVRAEFKNGACRLYLTPTDEWEKKLLGAVAKGGVELNAIVTYKPDGHFSHGNAAAIQVLLEAGGDA